MLIARTVFFLSLAATLFWVLGFAAERLAGTEPPIWAYAGAAILITVGGGYAILRAWPRFLATGTAGHSAFVRASVLWMLAAYVAGVICVRIAAYLLIESSAQPSDALRNEAAIAAWLVAFWLPLWFAPAVGLWIAWWRCDNALDSRTR